MLEREHKEAGRDSCDLVTPLRSHSGFQGWTHSRRRHRPLVSHPQGFGVHRKHGLKSGSRFPGRNEETGSIGSVSKEYASTSPGHEQPQHSTADTILLSSLSSAHLLLSSSNPNTSAPCLDAARAARAWARAVPSATGRSCATTSRCAAARAAQPCCCAQLLPAALAS
jgi:hypothetical protein